tara:strand:+ start:1820 stop:2659 length:840 start_codon:yes stop_codon:yes gene_type:complete
VFPEISHPGKLKNLEEILESLQSVIVAYSGGVDSAFLAVVANNVLGERALAVTAYSPSLTEVELNNAVELANKMKLNHRVIETTEIERPDYKQNTTARCYFCKDELYTQLGNIAQTEGYVSIANGTNLDDMSDFRPGLKAAKKYGVRSPLAESEFTKSDVREYSRRIEIPVWDKPSQACLSSRIPYGTVVTVEALTKIAKAEGFLNDLGLRQFRVRHHENIARIEVEPSEFGRLIETSVRESLVEYFKSIGYTYVTMDLLGFRSGSLNEIVFDQEAQSK